MTQIDEPNLDELREQLEEFAISLKPGTTKGKHRTGIFDTLELAKLVQALIATQIQETYKKGYIDGGIAALTQDTKGATQ